MVNCNTTYIVSLPEHMNNYNATYIIRPHVGMVNCNTAYIVSLPEQMNNYNAINAVNPPVK